LGGQPVKQFYLRDDFLSIIEPWLWMREIWFPGTGAPRPLKADNKEEFRLLIEKYGVNKPFGIYISTEIFQDPLKVKDKAESLRISWDFFLDLDSENLEDAKRAASKAVKALAYFNVESFILKFSGRRGFHLIIPGLSLDVFAPGEFRLAYPKLAVMLAEWFKAVINEPNVKVDLTVYKPRQMMRAPYSIHEETRLVSIPVEDPLKFRVKEAKIEHVKIHELPLKGRAGEAGELLESVREWWKTQTPTEPGLKIISRGKVDEAQSKAYRWIERLIESPIDDGRHRVLWFILAPYLVNVKGLSLEEAEQIALDYLTKCSRIKPIEGDLNRLVKYYVEYAARTGLKPPSLKTLRTKTEYEDLYKIISEAIKVPSSLLLKVKSLEDKEPEYEIESSLLVEVKAVYREVKKTFNEYPESKHWRENERRNMILGWLAERTFNMILDQLNIPHVWHHPLIQNEMVKEKEKAPCDFTIMSNEKVDVKASSSREKPKNFYVNFKRWEKHQADILVFLRFSPDLKRAWISGWLPNSELKNFPVKRLKYAPAYTIPAEKLKPFKTLLEKWSLGLSEALYS
jgi:hypothetical protein